MYHPRLPPVDGVAGAGRPRPLPFRDILPRNLPGERLLKRHYAWLIVAAGTMTIFSCIGLARFAYGMLLPSMSSALRLGYDRMGFVGTGNFAGYMCAVAFAPFVMRRAGARTTIAAGLSVLSLGMIGMGSAGGFGSLLVLYVFTGIGSGLANIPVMVLVSHWFTRAWRGKAAGVMVAGNGFAIVLAGFLVPWLNRSLGEGGWRAGWRILGGLSLVVAAVAWALVRDDPRDVGLSPYGEPEGRDPSGHTGTAPEGAGGSSFLVAHLGLIYLLFGATYTVYATFAVTGMVAERGIPEALAGRFWSGVGFFSLFSGLLFGSLSDRIGRKRGAALVFAVQTAAYLLVGLPLGTTALFFSVFLFGISAWSIPSIMAAAAGDYLGTARAAAGFSAITVFLGAGQVAGPAVAGVVAHATGGFGAAFLLAAGGALAAGAFSLLLPKPR